MKLNRITALLMLSTLPLMANAASYNVVELPTKDLSLNQFGSAIDETGEVLATLNTPFNPPIDLSLLDLSLFPLLDADGAAVGDFDDTDYNLIASFIYAQTNASSLTGQKLANQILYRTDGSDTSYISGLDQVTQDTNGFTFAQGTVAGDIVNGTHIVGSMSGPYNEIEYTTQENIVVNYVLNDFRSRGFVQVGENVTEFVPTDSQAGGISTAVAINTNLQVAGSVSITPNETLQALIDECSDEDLRGDQPIEACLFTLRLGNFTDLTTQRAAIWQVDNSGELIGTTTYDLVFTPEDDIVNILSTSATDINDSGVAVGVSDAPFSTTYIDTAVIFENGETIRIIEDEDLMPNVATGINNNGYVVGFQTYADGQVARTRIFTYDRNSNDLEFIDGFFVGSSAVPRAINNNNLVVGEADINGGLSARQKGGFLYSIGDDSFINLNTLIACNAEYNIISADGINDSDEIVASALVKRASRNLLGDIVLDANGAEVMVDTIVAVKLIPTGEEASDCNADADDEFIERQGASAGMFTLFGLFMIGMFRRRL